MGEIKVARIRFKDETTDYTIATSNIYFKNKNGKKTPFTPQHEKDFDKGKWYFATWICEDDECEKAEYGHTHLYKTSILLLAESEEDLERKIRRRVIYPNFRNMNDKDTSTPISNESSESDEEQTNCEIPKDVLFEYKKNQLKQRRNILSLFGDDNTEQNDTSDREDADRRSLNVVTPVPPQQSRENSPASSVGRSIQRVPNIHNERATDRNREDCRSQTIRSFKKKYQKNNALNELSTDEHFRLDVEAKRYDEKNSETYLGLDIWIDSDTWLSLQLQKKINIYIRDLADIIWTPIKLVNRYFDKSRISVKKIIEGFPREELEKDKLQLLRELLDDHLVKKNVGDQERKAIQARVRAILSKKIQDLRQHYRGVKRKRNIVEGESDEFIIQSYDIQ